MHTHRSVRSRPGFTLIEVLVATVLLAVALIAVEGTAATILRHIADLSRESLASQLVRRQSEQLRTAPCATDDGTDSINGVALRWSTTTEDQRLATTLTTSFLAKSGPRTESYRTLWGCHP